MDTSRFDRQTILPEIGHEGQRRLADAAVLIVGLGGLGAPVATYLAGAGVGRIGLCDNDVVSLSNLHRQVLYTNADIGRSKALCASEVLAARCARHVRLTPIPQGLTPDNAARIIADYDIVVDCTDNYATRYLIDDTCAEQHRPWVYGSIGAFTGQLAVMNGPAGRRYRHLYPDRRELEAAPRKVEGTTGALPGVIGALQVAEVLKIICGFGEVADGRLFTIDLRNLSTNIFDF